MGNFQLSYPAASSLVVSSYKLKQQAPPLGGHRLAQNTVGKKLPAYGQMKMCSRCAQRGRSKAGPQPLLHLPGAFEHFTKDTTPANSAPDL